MSSNFSVITCQEAQGCHGQLMLDVRTPAEYQEAHVAGSVLRPLQDLNTEEIKKMAGDKGCVVICRSGGRARQAADKLCAAGMANVKVMDGGITAWQSAGLPVNLGKKTISLERQVRIAAGFLALLGAVMSYAVNPAWIWLSGFIGAGLMFAGITDTCGMAMVLARMPWNNPKSCSVTKSCCN